MKTFTFYSYKGGVGRTLALVNIANRLAEFGKKVCILDFDLEAPGCKANMPKNFNSLSTKDWWIIFIHMPWKMYSPVIYQIIWLTFVLTNAINTIHLCAAGNVDSSDYWKNSHASIGGTYSTQKTVTALISF